MATGKTMRRICVETQPKPWRAQVRQPNFTLAILPDGTVQRHETPEEAAENCIAASEYVNGGHM